MKKRDSRRRGRSRAGLFGDDKLKFLSEILQKKDELPDAPNEKKIEVNELLERSNAERIIENHPQPISDSQTDSNLVVKGVLSEQKSIPRATKPAPPKFKVFSSISKPKPREKSSFSPLSAILHSPKPAQKDLHLHKEHAQRNLIAPLQKPMLSSMPLIQKSNNGLFSILQKKPSNCGSLDIVSLPIITKSAPTNHSTTISAVHQVSVRPVSVHHVPISHPSHIEHKERMQQKLFAPLITPKNLHMQISSKSASHGFFAPKPKSSFALNPIIAAPIATPKPHLRQKKETTIASLLPSIPKVAKSPAPLYTNFNLPTPMASNSGLFAPKPQSSMALAQMQIPTVPKEILPPLYKPQYRILHSLSKFEVSSGLFAPKPNSCSNLSALEPPKPKPKKILPPLQKPISSHPSQIRKFEISSGLFSTKPNSCSNLSALEPPKPKPKKILPPLQKPISSHPSQIRKFEVSDGLFTPKPHACSGMSQIHLPPPKPRVKRVIKPLQTPHSYSLQNISKYEVSSGLFSTKPHSISHLHEIHIPKPLFRLPKPKRVQKQLIKPHFAPISKISTYEVPDGIFAKKPHRVNTHVKEIFIEKPRKPFKFISLPKPKKVPKSLYKPVSFELKHLERGPNHSLFSPKPKSQHPYMDTIKYSPVLAIAPAVSQKLIEQKKDEIEKISLQKAPTPSNQKSVAGSFLSAFEFGGAPIGEPKLELEKKEEKPLILSDRDTSISTPSNLPSHSELTEKISQQQYKFDFSKLDMREWDTQYKQELSHPVPSQDQIVSYYKKSPPPQRKYLHALEVEAMYWKYAKSPPQGKEHSELEVQFMNSLENSSAEQRVAIEQCINLTKAVGAVSIFSNPQSSEQLANSAHEIYTDLITRHPNIRSLVNYQVARFGMYKSYDKKFLISNPDFESFISGLDDNLRDNAYAMRAAFFDRLMNDSGVSQPLRELAANEYSKLLIKHPGISSKLEIFLKVRRGFDLFFSSRQATTLEEQKRLQEDWQRIANSGNDVRTILFYELATLFYDVQISSLEKYMEDSEKK